MDKRLKNNKDWFQLTLFWLNIKVSKEYLNNCPLNQDVRKITYYVFFLSFNCTSWLRNNNQRFQLNKAYIFGKNLALENIESINS